MSMECIEIGDEVSVTMGNYDLVGIVVAIDVSRSNIYVIASRDHRPAIWHDSWCRYVRALSKEELLTHRSYLIRELGKRCPV